MPALNEAILLAPSAATAASGTLVVPGKGLGRYRACVLLLDVTAAATLAGDTLNVYVQKNIGPPGGTAGAPNSPYLPRLCPPGAVTGWHVHAMVRKGSPVRVRKRACENPRH